MIFNLSKKTPKFPLKDRKLLEEIITATISASQLDKILPEVSKEINIVLMSDPQITEINETYLQHEGATDVISFDYIDDYDEDFQEDDEDFVIGELYVSLDTALSQSAEYDQVFQDEVVLYIAHGMLHLIGYDDHEEEDIKEMRAAEHRVMSALRKQFDHFNFI